MTPWLTRMVCIALLACLAFPASAQEDILKRLDNDTSNLVSETSRSVVGVQVGRSYGSGFAIAPDLVLTSTGVLNRPSTNILLYMHDASVARAQVVAIDQSLCAVLLKVSGRKLQPLGWSDSHDVGTGVFTLGNPYGSILTVQRIAASFGNISARYRVRGDRYYDGEVFEVSAAVNHGSFGGPVVTTTGKVAGMVHRSVSYKRWFGVAIPARHLRRFVAEYHSGKARIETPEAETSAPQPKGEPGFLGVKVKNVVHRSRDRQVRMVQITAVAPDSPAARAGLKAGDVILRLNRLPVRSVASFGRMMGVLKAGQPVLLQIFRRGTRPFNKRVLLSTLPM